MRRIFPLSPFIMEPACGDGSRWLLCFYCRDPRGWTEYRPRWAWQTKCNLLKSGVFYKNFSLGRGLAFDKKGEPFFISFFLLLSSLRLIKFYFYPLDVGGFLSSLPSLKILSFPFDALRPRRAPTFWPAESRQRLAKEGCAPFGIPPLAVALEWLRHNRARGVTELLAASRQELPRRFAKALPQSRNERCPMRVRA